MTTISFFSKRDPLRTLRVQPLRFAGTLLGGCGAIVFVTASTSVPSFDPWASQTSARSPGGMAVPAPASGNGLSRAMGTSAPSVEAGPARAPGPPRTGADPAHSRARSLIAEALKLPTSYERLRPLTDTIGARLAGSEAEPRAVAWAKREFQRDGLDVRLEPVMVPVWIRGKESGEIVRPSRFPLVLLGLGGTIGTPEEGIEAPVVVVTSLDDLSRTPREKVEGRIVLFDNPFPRSGDEFKDYGEAVKCRSEGASAAAKLGAVGALVRSVATSSLRTPHTGGMTYKDDAPKIPAAAITLEDAEHIHRLVDSGVETRVRLVLGARTAPDREGANVVAEIRGREAPEEIVLIGAHLDSWDVGTGAIDDGAGCVMVLETMRLIASGPRPRRTVRAVLFANEENGARGGKGYRDAHAGELARHVAAVEADSGAARPLGFDIEAGPGGEGILRNLLTPSLASLGAGRIRGDGGGTDIDPLKEHGVPLLGLVLEGTRYFDYHHTMADTLDKVDPLELQQATAALAATTWILAETETRLPRVPPRAVPEKP